jgi:hypothetical protein
MTARSECMGFNRAFDTTRSHRDLGVEGGNDIGFNRAFATDCVEGLMHGLLRTNHELSLITPFSARPSRLQPCACARKRARHSAGLLRKEVCSRLVPNQSSFHGTVVHVTGIESICPRRITILAQSSDPCTPLQSSR